MEEKFTSVLFPSSSQATDLKLKSFSLTVYVQCCIFCLFLFYCKGRKNKHCKENTWNEGFAVVVIIVRGSRNEGIFLLLKIQKNCFVYHIL